MAYHDHPHGHLTAVARAFPNPELPRGVARLRIASHATDVPVAPFADCVYVGRGVGLTNAEMQRNSGLSKQTLYRLAPPEPDLRREPPPPQAWVETLILLGHAAQFTPLALVAASGALDEGILHQALRRLEHDGLCTLRRDDYSGALEASPMPAAYDTLRGLFDDLYLRRVDGFSIYVRVLDGQRDQIARGAANVLGDQDHTLLEPSVAPSIMEGPELAFLAATATPRTAIALTRDIWAAILEDQGIPFAEPVITNIIPPGPASTVASGVLDTFFEAVIDTGAPAASTIRDTRAAYTGDASERVLAGRCLTMAAIALRRAVGNTEEPRPIGDGDAAFSEWQVAHALSVDDAVEPIRAAAAEALDLATERLGPIAGGRLAHVRAPDQPPVVVQNVRPTPQELTMMARLSGTAVGTAALLGSFDGAEAMRRIVTGAGRWS